MNLEHNILMIGEFGKHNDAIYHLLKNQGYHVIYEQFLGNRADRQIKKKWI